MLLTLGCSGLDVTCVIEALSRDCVILIRNVSPSEADGLVHQIAGELGLQKKLELEAGFSDFLGHRRRINKYFMSVNSREDYQFVTPHSEGDRISNMQLSCFYCFENSKDGGETILLNIDDTSEAWGLLREKTTKILPGSKPLSRGMITRAKALYRLSSPDDYLVPDDQIVAEVKSEIPGLLLAIVMARPKRSFSLLLGRDVNVLWDNIGSVDQSCLHFFVRMLQERELLKFPPDGFELHQLDPVNAGRSWCSGADYEKLFCDEIILKLKPGDLVILNNLTWAHAVNNWTSAPGTRRIAVALA